jgi:hypothetical protein
VVGEPATFPEYRAALQPQSGLKFIDTPDLDTQDASGNGLNAGRDRPKFEF